MSEESSIVTLGASQIMNKLAEHSTVYIAAPPIGNAIVDDWPEHTAIAYIVRQAIKLFIKMLAHNGCTLFICYLDGYFSIWASEEILKRREEENEISLHVIIPANETPYVFRCERERIAEIMRLADLNTETVLPYHWFRETALMLTYAPGPTIFDEYDNNGSIINLANITDKIEQEELT